MEAVIFAGLPGAGKSTFYREGFFTTPVRIGEGGRFVVEEWNDDV